MVEALSWGISPAYAAQAMNLDREGEEFPHGRRVRLRRERFCAKVVSQLNKCFSR